MALLISMLEPEPLTYYVEVLYTEDLLCVHIGQRAMPPSLTFILLSKSMWHMLGVHLDPNLYF